MSVRRFLIDTDTASDDAVAILMALRTPDIQVEAITTVAGNVDVDQAAKNALNTVELCAADVPVYRGLAKPMLREHRDAKGFHGPDGMGGVNLPDPVTMAIAIDHTVCTQSGRHYVDVEITSELTRGETVVDRFGVTGHEPNIEVCYAVDAERFKEILFEAVKWQGD